MKLIHKFFLAFFVTNIAFVGVMFASLYISFSTGFHDFVEQEEKMHVIRMKYQLVTLYQDLGSWEPLKENIALWRTIVMPEQETSGSSLEKALKTGQRVSLYNQYKQVIVGRTNLSENPHVETILLNNEVIGWLGLVPSRNEQASPATAFLKAQFNNYFVITIWVVAFAFALAIFLSRHLAIPIKQILRGTDALIKGHLNRRITTYRQDELGALFRNFNELAQTLEHNQKIRQAWMSDTSHELRTPLTVLHSHLMAIQDGVFAADNKRISLLIEQVENLNLLVDDLAQLACNDAASLAFSNTSVDLSALLRSLVEIYAPRFVEQGLTLAFDSLNNGDKWIVQGDQKRLHQLFSNLLENSCRYTYAGGEAIITGYKEEDKICITLQDSAPGVSSDDKPRLTERFFRVEKSRSRKHGGAGLGLAICEHIAREHGGCIIFDDGKLGGLKVTIKLHSRSEK